MSHKHSDWDPLDDLAEAAAMARKALVAALSEVDGTEFE